METEVWGNLIQSEVNHLDDSNMQQFLQTTRLPQTRLNFYVHDIGSATCAGTVYMHVNGAAQYSRCRRVSVQRNKNCSTTNREYTSIVDSNRLSNSSTLHLELLWMSYYATVALQYCSMLSSSTHGIGKFSITQYPRGAHLGKYLLATWTKKTCEPRNRKEQILITEDKWVMTLRTSVSSSSSSTAGFRSTWAAARSVFTIISLAVHCKRRGDWWMPTRLLSVSLSYLWTYFRLFSLQAFAFHTHGLSGACDY